MPVLGTRDVPSGDLEAGQTLFPRGGTWGTEEWELAEWGASGPGIF